MDTVIDEFRKRRSYLSTLRFGDDKGRLADFLNWMERQPEVNAILQRLRGIDVESLFSLHGFAPKAQSQDDVCAIGLYLLDKAKAGVSLHSSAIKRGIRPRYNGAKGQDYIDEAMRCYINPLCDHVESALESLENVISAEDASLMRFGLFAAPKFKTSFPKTNSALRKIGEYCSQTDQTASWFHVATSCRELLGTFVRELQTLGVIMPSPELKQGDTKGILNQLVRERPGASDNLIDLIQAIWKYVQSNVHRQTATKEDALRVYLWTSLLISEVWLIIPAQSDASGSVIGKDEQPVA